MGPFSQILYCLVLVILVSYAQCAITSIPLPASLQSCLVDKNLNHAILTDEEAIGTCMTEFMWLNNRKCKGISKWTMNWFASLAVNRSRSLDHTLHNSPRERKEYRVLNDAERNDYHRAVNALKRNTDEFPNKYDAFAIFHQGLAGTAAHRGPAFLGWHRYFLFLYEQALQEEVPGVMLPYWDSTIDAEMTDPTDSVIWTEIFLGTGNGSVKTGPFANWVTSAGELTRAIGQGQLMNKERVRDAIRNHSNHTTFGPDIEMQHDNVHLWVGGHMGRIEIAPFDPVFYMHHAFIDCIWEQFRDRLKSNNIDPANDYPTGTGGHEHYQRMINLPPFKSRRPSQFNGMYLTNKDGYRDFWTDEYYKCAPMPECSYVNPNCGSIWLECNIFLNRCVSKGSAAALPKVTPDQMMTASKQLFPNRRHSNTVSFDNLEDLPVLTKEIIFSGDMFYLYLNSLHVAEHQVFKRATFLRQGNVIHEIQTRRVQPLFQTMHVTWPMVPFHHVQTTSSTVFDHETTHRTTPRPRFTRRPRVRTRPSTHRGTISDLSNDWSIGEFYIPKIDKPCDGYPIQNTFVMDCIANTNLWAFVPVKVVHVRHGDLRYTTYPVGEDGRYAENNDIYSQGWLTFFNGRPIDKRPTLKNCRNDKSGLVKIRMTSYGINYAGTYSDHVFIDNRQPVASAISFIAVKSPNVRETKVLFTAVDQCGIACRAYCLVKQKKNKYPKYEECNGAVSITSESSYGYATSYREAAKKVWCPNSDIPDPDSVMYADDSQVPVIFYCDYQNYRPEKLFTKQ